MKEVIYSAEQIRIPPEFPDILKEYSKFILKSQPSDLVVASAEYLPEYLDSSYLLDISNNSRLHRNLKLKYRQKYVVEIVSDLTSYIASL